MVAGAGAGETLVAGLDDGRVWACDLASERRVSLRADRGAHISALATLPGGRVAWGDEAGEAGILAIEGL